MAAFWLSALPACQSQIGQDAGQQAADLDRAIQALRAAPNPDKRQYLARLRDVRCSDPQLALLKRVCERGYAKHVRALDRVAQVKRKLAQGHKQELTAVLEQARADLLSAGGDTEECVRQQVAMKHRFQLQ